MMPDFASRFVGAQDGLKLHVRCYAAATKSHRLPVICLPGLARTGADFHRLALALSGDTSRPRQVFALDYRGRGRSDYDPDPANYNVAVELNDVLTVLAALAVERAVFIGTSRGGILTMLLAATGSKIVAGAVLNDIGPVVELQGLLRIKSYVGKLPQPANFEEAGEMLRQLFAAQFTSLAPADWTAFAQRTFEERDGKLVPSYDRALAQTLAAFEGDQPFPPLWSQFDALAGVPLMVIRGQNSDLLSPSTVAAMRQRRPDLVFAEVAGQGHAPLLAEDDIIAQICDFVASCDSSPT